MRPPWRRLGWWEPIEPFEIDMFVRGEHASEHAGARGGLCRLAEPWSGETCFAAGVRSTSPHRLI